MIAFGYLRLSLLAVCSLVGGASSLAASYDLTIAEDRIQLKTAQQSTIVANQMLPAPTLHWQEDEWVTLNVTNQLKEASSLHWHGIILPYQMDGVPHISFHGIDPGETFRYHFQVKQSGTYWYHGHSGMQEQTGLYGAIIIDPKVAEPPVQRDYVVLLSDFPAADPARTLARLKSQPDYYNFQKRTVATLWADFQNKGIWDTLKDRLEWGEMRMEPTDIADVTGATYTFLVNGQPPDKPWLGLFKPGEKVRLRFINAAAMTHFDIRIPGLSMQVVEADGQAVQPVVVDEFRMAVAETYTVIVEPQVEQAYSLFAEAMDRSGYASATLAPRAGMQATLPAMRPMQLLTMADMGGAHSGHAGHHAHPAATDAAALPAPSQHNMAEMSEADMAAMPEHAMQGMKHNTAEPVGHVGHSTEADAPKQDSHAMHNMAAMTAAEMAAMPEHAMPGMQHSAAEHAGHEGHSAEAAASASDSHAMHNMAAMQATPNSPTPAQRNASKVLAYSDLIAAQPSPAWGKVDKEITLRLTGNMNRYIWSFDDVKYADAAPIKVHLGEHLRLHYVNETMMNHPIHMHGLWQYLDTGRGLLNPKKHVINVKPGTTVTVDVLADALGEWAFHCHLMYHMETGMFRKLVIEPAVQTLSGLQP